MKPQVAFEYVVSREPKDVDFEALQTVALAVWYQGYTPDVSTISNEHQIRMSSTATSSIECVSRAACRWGLQSDFKGLLVQLLPFQICHYARYVSNEVDDK
ncbi:hypothetical protein [Vibrio chagasii]|uniref:hypothetical protein n=1 Tax=Vibrio chagasii TaxID=170679 RepID=UPI0016400CD7|nr:hypothetical protein [Vibrio chagasii]